MREKKKRDLNGEEKIKIKVKIKFILLIYVLNVFKEKYRRVTVVVPSECGVGH